MAPPYEVKSYKARSAFDADRKPRDPDLDLGLPIAELRRALVDEIIRQMDEKPLTGAAKEQDDELQQQMANLGRTLHGGRAFRVSDVLRFGTRSGIDTSSGTLTFQRPRQELVSDTWTNPLEQMGASVVLSDAPAFYVKPTVSGGVTVSAENPGSDVSAGTVTFKRKDITMHEMIGLGPYFSRQLVRHNPATLDYVVTGLIRNTHAKLTTEALTGSGSGAHPTGLFVDGDVPVLALGTNGAAVTAAVWADMQRKVGEASATLANSKLGFITTPGVKAQAQVLVRATGAQTVWTADTDVMGQPGLATAAAPSNLTKGTSTTVCHGIVFGDWSQLYLHMSPTVEIVVDQYTLKKQGLIEVASYLLFDTAIPTPGAFVTVADVLVPDIP